MSRIDDAWKRAGGEGAANDRVRVPIAAVPASSHAAALDRYPVEQPARVEARRPPASVPVPRRDVPAPPPATLTIPSALHGKLVVAPGTESLWVEQYRRLAASLEELQAQRSVKSVTVSSALPREGKTLTTTNLALTLSETYRRRVLLIDADFHRPSIHDMFGLPNTLGLGEALRARDGTLPAVRLSPTLSVLPTGQVKDDPLAALSAERLRTLITHAAERFDWIFIDTPPLGVVTDAQLVSRATDGVLLVIGAGITPYTLVQQTLTDFGIERVIGTVLNRVEEHTIPVREYYRRHYDARA